MAFMTLIIIAIVIVIPYVYNQRKRRIIATVTSLTRGEPSERDLIYRLVRGGIPPQTIFHDLYVATKCGYSQVDLVVPTNVGIFVFEVKDYSGWIYGNGRSENWTQVLAYGQEKHQFYNPIKQNQRHIEALRNSLPQLKNIPFYSVVVFYGSSEIKALSNIPYDCRVAYPSQVVKLIKGSMSELTPAPYTNKWEVMELLKQSVLNGEDQDIVAYHLRVAQNASIGKRKSTYSYNYIPRKWRRFRGW